MTTLLQALEQWAGDGVDQPTPPVERPSTATAEFTIDQPVFHEAYGYGEVTAIDGEIITFRARKEPNDIHVVAAGELVTKAQAEAALEATWNACGFQEYRRRMGKWCSITKSLCRHGEWDDVCERYGLNLRTTNDWIRDFENEQEWLAQDAARAARNKSAESTDLNPSDSADTSGHSVYAVTGTRQVNERTPDSDNDKREEEKVKEQAKRSGIDPTPHKTTLSHQRRNLDPVRLALYYKIRATHEKQVREIMDRKMDEGIAEVLALDPETANPAILMVLEVRSLLRNQGFKDAEINHVQLDPALGFDALVRSALDQLRAVKGA
jgi:hypothetical protein